MGEYGRRDLRVAVEAPLSDTISGKISVLQQKSDGFYKARYKTHPDYSVPAQMAIEYGGDYQDTGGDDVFAVRPMLEFNPNENFTLTLIGEYSTTLIFLLLIIFFKELLFFLTKKATITNIAKKLKTVIIV